MRLPAVNCIILAYAVASIASVDARPKRDLLYLKNLLTSKLFGISTQTSPILLQDDDNVKIFRLPGFDDILIKAVRKVTNATEEAVPDDEPKPAVAQVQDPTPASLESFLGTKTQAETLSALQGIKNLLKSGILNAQRDDIEIMPVVPVSPPPAVPDVFVVPQSIDVIPPQKQYSYQQLQGDGSLMTYASEENEDVIVKQTNVPLPPPPPFITDRLQRMLLMRPGVTPILSDVPSIVMPEPLALDVPSSPLLVSPPVMEIKPERVDVKVNHDSNKASVSASPSPALLSQLVPKPLVGKSPVDGPIVFPSRNLKPISMDLKTNPYSYEQQHSDGSSTIFTGTDILTKHDESIVKDSVMESESSPYDDSSEKVDANPMSQHPKKSGYPYKTLRHYGDFLIDENGKLYYNHPNSHLYQNSLFFPQPITSKLAHNSDHNHPSRFIFDGNDKQMFDTKGEVKVKVNNKYWNRHDEVPKIRNIPSSGYYYDQHHQDGSISTYRDNPVALVKETRKVIPAPPPQILDRIEKVAASAHATEKQKGSSGHRYKLVTNQVLVSNYGDNPEFYSYPMTGEVEVQRGEYSSESKSHIPHPGPGTVQVTRSGQPRFSYCYKLTNNAALNQNMKYFYPEPATYYKQVNNDGKLTTFMGSEDNYITGASKAIPAAPSFIVNRLENIAVNAQAGRIPQVSTGYSYKLQDSQAFGGRNVEFISHPGPGSVEVTVGGKPAGSNVISYNQQAGNGGSTFGTYQDAIFLTEPVESTYIYRNTNSNNPKPLTVNVEDQPTFHTQGESVGKRNMHEHLNSDGNKYLCVIKGGPEPKHHFLHQIHHRPVFPNGYVFVPPPMSYEAPRPTEPKVEEVKPSTISSRLNNDGSAHLNESKTVAEEEVKVETVPTWTSLVSNPIVVAPEKQIYMYKQASSDGSTMTVAGNKQNTVTVEINESAKEPDSSRGDIPETLS